MLTRVIIELIFERLPHVHMMAVTPGAADVWKDTAGVPEVGRHFFRFVTEPLAVDLYNSGTVE